MTATQLKSDIESLMRKLFLTFIVLTFVHIVFAQNKQTIVVRPETELEKTVREAETAKEVIGFFGELFQGAAADRLNNVKNSRYSVFVEKKLEPWKRKGTFEKTEDWQKRLNDNTAIKKSEIYESALDEFVQELKVLNNNTSLNGLFYDSKGYDSDKEVLVVNTFWGNTPIPIPLDEARNMQDDFRYLNLEPHFFIQNDQLALVSLTFPYKGKRYTWENQSQAAQIIRNKRLELEQIALNKRLELERLDLLELATYNQRLDSIFKDYNHQLLQNPYNVHKRVLTDYEKITATGTENRQNSFDRQVSYMKGKIEYLNKDFSRDFESEYGDFLYSWGRSFFFVFFSSKDEFDALYKQGIDIYSQWKKVCDYFRQAYSRAGYLNYREKEIFSTIRDCQSKPYYPQVINFVIEVNRDLSYEWRKNGQFFENKVEFYNAYISDDYKEILKTNKKILKANKKK